VEVALLAKWPESFYQDTPIEKVAFLYGRQGAPESYELVLRTVYQSGYPGMSFTITGIVEGVNDLPPKYARTEYGIKMSQWRMAVNRGNLVGIAHTHPWRFGGRPSRNDLEGLPAGLLGVVVSGLEHREAFYIGRSNRHRLQDLME
jgi:proteasome lid subunit RPN8/RPN11